MRFGFASCVLSLLALQTGWSGEKTAGKPLTLVDSAGKEITLKNWKIISGTKHLSWLEPGEKEPAPVKGKKAGPTPPSGPECLEFRERKAEMFKDDVVTYIPLSAIKQIDYDQKIKEVRVIVLVAEGKELTLRGSTEYVGINKYNLDGEIDSGTLNVGGAVKLQDGFLRAGIQSIKFPDAKPAPEGSGSKAIVITRGKEKTKHDVMELQPLYKTGAQYRLTPTLLFQKTVKVDLKDLTKMSHLAAKEKKGGTLDFNVEKRDGTKQGLTLLDKMTEEKETTSLAGLVGRVPVGYRLFPATIIAEVSWSEAKE